jgi:hypothetical protein
MKGEARVSDSEIFESAIGLLKLNRIDRFNNLGFKIGLTIEFSGG